MKKILLILFLTLITIPTFAEEVVKDGIRYDVDMNSKTATVLGAKDGCPSKLVIPSKLGIFKVTAIEEEAFKNFSNLISVTFPEGLKTIGDDAFFACENLSSVTFPEGLESIEYGAFRWCSNLSSVTFPEGLKTIGDKAFYKCENLSSVTFPEGLETIGGRAFYSCKNLSSVTFPEGLETIGNSAFSGCSNLSSVTFPEGLQTIGNSAFYECSKLSSVTFPEGLQTIGHVAFYSCDNLSSVTFPEGLQTIGNEAFYHCSTLSSVTFPDGLQTIGNKAFHHCSTLSSVTFPDGLQTIGNEAFMYCIRLSSVTSYIKEPNVLKGHFGYRNLFVPPYLKSSYQKEYPTKDINLVYPTIKFHKFNEVGYATFNGFISYKKSSLFSAYTATLEGDVLMLHEIKGKVIPAHTPMILISLVGMDEVKLKPADSELEPIKENVLSGILAGQKMEGQKDYYLNFTNDKPGMYHHEKDTFWLKHNSAYLDASKWDGAEGLKFDFSDIPAGIDDVMVEALKKSIFNIKGQRVNDMQPGKVYIVNGRKVMIK